MTVLDEAHSAVKAGLALNRSLHHAPRPRHTDGKDDTQPEISGASSEPIFEGMRKAGFAGGMTPTLMSWLSAPALRLVLCGCDKPAVTLDNSPLQTQIEAGRQALGHGRTGHEKC